MLAPHAVYALHAQTQVVAHSQPPALCLDGFCVSILSSSRLEACRRVACMTRAVLCERIASVTFIYNSLHRAALDLSCLPLYIVNVSPHGPIYRVESGALIVAFP